MPVELAPGSAFAGYRIEAEVGRGGMGVVYRATDLRLERPVALKLIAPELAEDERFRSRFLRESKLAASLDHPSVVPIHEAGEHNGQLFIAMRYVEGSDLKELLTEEGTLAPERALAICSQVADALDAAHERGLVHRDVKPGNVLLDEREHAYLSDFGLTKQLGGASTQTGQVVGTLDYLAPEQIRGEELDGRTDEYALACLLYECLSGKPPFRRETEAETLWAHMQDAPPPLRAYPGLDPVFGKALAKENGGRYGSCGELVAATRTALGLEAPAWPRRPLRRVLLRRWRLIAAAGALVLAGGVAGLVVALTTGGGGRLEPVGTALAAIDAQTGRVATFTEFEAPPSNIAVGEGTVWALNAENATVSRIDPKTGRIVKTFETGGRPSDLAAGLGAVWVGNSGGGFGNHTVSISRVDLETGKVTRMVKLPEKRTAPSNPSQGTPQIAVGASAVWAMNPDRTISRIDPKSGRLVETIDVNAHWSIAAGKEGVWFLIERGGNAVAQIDPRTNRVVRKIPISANVISGIAVGAGSVWVLAPNEGLVWRVEPGESPALRTIDVGFGEGYLAFGDGAVWTANFQDNTVSRIDPGANTVTAKVRLGGAPWGLAVGGGSAWVSVAGGTPERTLPAYACSEIDSGGREPDVLIASDLPLQGPGAAVARAMADAIRSVLKKHAFRAGAYAVGYQSCDDSTAQSGLMEFRKCAANANAYAQAKRLVAVIGPADSFCAQVMLPALNEAPGGPLMLISPTNTHPDLTRPVPRDVGAIRGAPDVYYPTGVRSYVRLAARDDLEGVAHAMLAKQLGLNSVYLLTVGGPPGDTLLPRFRLTDPFRRTARKLGVRIAGSATYDPQAGSYDALAERVARSRAQGVLLASAAFPNVPDVGSYRLLRALRGRLGTRVAIMVGNDWAVIPDLFEFVGPTIPEVLEFVGPAALGVYVSTPIVPSGALERSLAVRRAARELGLTPPSGTPLSGVLQAAQAAEVVLQAIERSDGTRASVLKELQATEVRDGILGSFRFDRSGDMTPAPVAILRLTGRTPLHAHLPSNYQGAVVDRVLYVPSG